ncbi:MAG: DUF853 family protein [Actinobacteria bacterium]|nr:DUF853 family protein [Actinomycetota bacterium]
MADLTLGAQIDLATGQKSETASILPTSELTTHGVIIGMTGSGKTGLGVVLIEEVLSSGVPALLIDPKGDLTNLLLLFPGLTSEEFRPWVNESDAQNASLGLDEFAAQQATTWREGLEGWGIGPERLAAQKAAVEFAIYTPGSTAGRPLNIVGSLQAPPVGTDPEIVGDEIDGYVTSMLGMLGISGDPLSSREHILLANIIQNAWSQGQSLELADLLAQVQQPPMRKLGVLELDVFFPPKDRMEFAMKINGLLASPSFATWLQGEPIDIQSLLFTADGRPRCAVITTAHLSDEQRQSVTSLVLSKLVTWMRRQSGTSDLRALLYMDEVAGYLPPTANPPTKKPIMLLLKQARAFGLGVVLSTQNPVDLDYKALSNTGIWIVGRLQTEQDKKRLLDGLSSATGGVDVGAVSETLGNLGKRQFVMRRASKNAPEVMTSRWAMSYLRGPLTREQIGQIERAPAAPAPPAAPAAPAVEAAEAPVTAAADVPSAPAPEAPVTAAADVPSAPAPSAPLSPAAPVTMGDDESPVMPSIAQGIPISFVDPATPWLAEVGAVSGGSHLRAAAVARVNLRYDDRPSNTLHNEEYEAVMLPLPEIPTSGSLINVDYDDRDFISGAPVGAAFGFVPAEAKNKTYWTALQRAIIDELTRTKTTEILVNPTLKLYSRVGETPEEFAVRCDAAADQGADKAMAALRSKYETKLATARGKASDSQITANQLQQELTSNYGLGAAVGSVLGGLLGARKTRAQMSAEAKREKAMRAKADAAVAKTSAATDAVTLIEQQLNDELLALDAEWAQKAKDVTTKPITLSKSDITVTDFRCVWIPVA